MRLDIIYYAYFESCTRLVLHNRRHCSYLVYPFQLDSNHLSSSLWLYANIHQHHYFGQNHPHSWNYQYKLLGTIKWCSWCWSLSCYSHFNTQQLPDQYITVHFQSYFCRSVFKYQFQFYDFVRHVHISARVDFTWRESELCHSDSLSNRFSRRCYEQFDLLW